MQRNSIFSHVALFPVPKTEPETTAKKIETFSRKETERFKNLDYRLNSAEIKREYHRKRNRKKYRFWSIECKCLIETFTARSSPDDTQTGIALTAESKDRIKRLRRLQRMIE